MTEQVPRGLVHERHERGVLWKIVPFVVEVRREHEYAALPDGVLGQRRGPVRKPRQNSASASLPDLHRPSEPDLSQRTDQATERSKDGVAGGSDGQIQLAVMLDWTERERHARPEDVRHERWVERGARHDQHASTLVRELEKTTAALAIQPLRAHQYDGLVVGQPLLGQRARTEAGEGRTG